MECGESNLKLVAFSQNRSTGCFFTAYGIIQMKCPKHYRALGFLILAEMNITESTDLDFYRCVHKDYVYVEREWKKPSKPDKKLKVLFYPKLHSYYRKYWERDPTDNLVYYEGVPKYRILSKAIAHVRNVDGSIIGDMIHQAESIT